MKPPKTKNRAILKTESSSEETAIATSPETSPVPMVRVVLNVPLHGHHAGEEIELPADDVRQMPQHYFASVSAL